MNVYKRLNEARKSFHSLKLAKSGYNKFAGYRYFELADFLVPALEVFDRFGLCATVTFEGDYARMDIINIDKPEERITIHSPLSSAELKGAHPIQNLGAVESYQRRYLWMAALEIVEHDAIDASEPVDKGKKAGVIKPTDGAEDALTTGQQAEVQRIADAIEGAFVDGNEWGAYEEWETVDGSVEFKTAVWKLLGSKTRAAIKRMKEQAKQTEPETV